MARTPNLAALIIMDGVALNPKEEGNAVRAARTPVLDRLFATCPWSTLSASGRDVGLMDGQMGDSNVGHLNIGAGRIVKQYVLRILDSIDDGSFFSNEALVDACDRAAETGKALHVLGIVSPGGVHGHSRIVEATARLAKERGAGKVYLHTFTDGRDVPPKSALEHFKEFLPTLPPGVRVASVGGRYYAMDRDQRWERTKKAYDAVVLGEGHVAADPLEAIRAAYDRGETDEFITPTVIAEGGRPVAAIEDGDIVIWANFRTDRARQLSRALIFSDFDGFDRGAQPPAVHFTSMTQIDQSFDVPFAFEPQDMSNLLGDVVASRGWKQLRIAETEKYAHVTYFFNGGRDEPLPGEVRQLIPSPKVATYDLKPEMSAFEVTDTAIRELESGAYRLLVLNFANGDMVGHTGVFEAAVKAVETVDACVGRVLDAVRRLGGDAIVTADHGNADQMIDYETGGPHTYHTLHRVPCIYVGDREGAKLRDGRLADLAPTILDILGLEKPKEMDGATLFVR